MRNRQYDTNAKPRHQFPLPVIGVGNLTVGGTGKTPHVEYLIRLLKNQYAVATLSRGYGRQTKGFILADAQASAATIGDEPMQFYRKFAGQIDVAVGEKRVEAIQQLRTLRPHTQLILLDDAFQHRAVQPSLNILLTDYTRPFYQDFVLPAGRLRERRQGANRADLILVTKCPDGLVESERTTIVQRIRPYARPETPVFFTGIRYGKPVAFREAGAELESPACLVSGLANAKPLKLYVKQHYQLVRHLAFPDHHVYTHRDVANMLLAFRQSGAKSLLTTEKDFVKLDHSQFTNTIGRIPAFYLPIEVYFLFDQQATFDDLIKEHVAT